MKYDMHVFSSNLVESIGLTIIDTAWQGLLIGLGLFLVLGFTKVNASRIRYRIAMLALASMMAWAGYSFVNHYENSLKETISFNNQLSVLDAETDITRFFSQNERGGGGLISLIHDFLHPHASFITGIWLCGMFFLCIRLAGGLVYVRQLRTNSSEITDSFWLEKIAGLKKRIGIRKITKILESASVNSPITMGYLHPVIILPVGMLTGVPTAQLESILVHELIHIKKADYLVNIFQSAVEIIFFYHPVTWFISHIIQKERENRCDQLTVRFIDNPMSYAKALTAIGQNHITNTAPKFAMSARSGNDDLSQRIFRILNLENPKPHKNRVMAALLLLLLSIGFFSFYAPGPQVQSGLMDTEMVDDKQVRDEEIIQGYHDDTIVKKEASEEIVEELLMDIRINSETEKDPEPVLKERNTPVTKKNDTIPPSKQQQTNLKKQNTTTITVQKHPSPIYYVDGKKTDQQQVNLLNISMIKSIEVLKGQRAIDRFGIEGQNGVILISTKALSNSAKTEKEKNLQLRLLTDQQNADSGDVRLLNGKVSIKSSDTTSEGTMAVIKTDNYLQEPLMVIDGKPSDSSIKSLKLAVSPEEIASVHVLKGASATAIYGEKGAHGVVLVTTKKKNTVLRLRSDTILIKPDIPVKDSEATGDEPLHQDLNAPEIYPNPSTGVFNIRFKLDHKSKVGIHVYDLNGKLIDKVQRKSFSKGAHNLTWEAKDTPAGNYILHFTNGKQTIKHQIIIQK